MPSNDIIGSPPRVWQGGRPIATGVLVALEVVDPRRVVHQQRPEIGLHLGLVEIDGHGVSRKIGEVNSGPRAETSRSAISRVSLRPNLCATQQKQKGQTWHDPWPQGVAPVEPGGAKVKKTS